MTVQKAIDILQHYISNSEHHEATRMAIYALKKEIQKNPTHEASLYRCNTCPTCKQVIDTNIYEEILPGQKVRIRYQRCHFCGQAIDWSDSE